jgi:hypothetical protein
VTIIASGVEPQGRHTPPKEENGSRMLFWDWHTGKRLFHTLPLPPGSN